MKIRSPHDWRASTTLSPHERKQMEDVAGKPVAEMMSTLLRAVDPDAIAGITSGVLSIEPIWYWSL